VVASKRDESRLREKPQQIADELRAMIVSGKLSEGDSLGREPELVERFGVSRPSLREALRILEDQGLIILKPGPGGGPVVAAMGTHDFGRVASLYFQTAGTTLRELGEALVVIEPVMARQAAERATSEGKSELRAHLERVRHRERGQATLVSDTDEFHRKVAQLSGNGVLGLVATAVRELYEERVLATIYAVHGPAFVESAEETFDTHDSIAAAILAGRGAKAESLMRAHVLDFISGNEERFPELLDQVITWQ
jgi:GntR family transcriptional regulator, transcriptional repressor for pyruvate dehydrogenase complex